MLDTVAHGKYGYPIEPEVPDVGEELTKRVEKFGRPVGQGKTYTCAHSCIQRL
jgi:hypothetical protein